MTTRVLIRAVNSERQSNFVLEYKSETDACYCLKKALPILNQRGVLTAVQMELPIDFNGIQFQASCPCGGKLVLHGVVATCDKCSNSLKVG